MIRVVFRIVGTALLFALLTLITQVGGIIYLLSLGIARIFRTRISNGMMQRFAPAIIFLALYFLSTVLFVPLIAKQFGREPLPWSGDLKPRNVLTCILNRHYVRPDLKRLARESTEKLRVSFPGTIVNYLDANFPFYNGFPLAPHLSHNDGRKLDLALLYTDLKGNPVEDTPSSIGYGVFVDPRPGDDDYVEICERKGYWQYGALAKIVPQGRKKDFLLDVKREKAFVKILASDNRLQILLIEPHLKARMNLTSSKIRFHGCHAVRHDDHIHIQIR